MAPRKERKRMSQLMINNAEFFDGLPVYDGAKKGRFVCLLDKKDKQSAQLQIMQDQLDSLNERMKKK